MQATNKTQKIRKQKRNYDFAEFEERNQHKGKRKNWTRHDKRQQLEEAA